MNTLNLVKTSGICISREFEKSEFYNSIKNDLTRHSREYQKSTFITNKFFLEGRNILKIPRFYPVENYINDFKIINKLNDGYDIKINHNIILRDDLQKNIVKYMLNNKSGIIQANPGSGKTIVSIYSIATIKKKTIILVHRESLLHQWIGPGTQEKKQGFLSYTDINKSEIGILTSYNFKETLKKSIILVTDQTFTSLLRRNREEFLLELNNSNIGLFLADEVHTTVGAPTFAECSIHIPANIVFGLSATPYRWDGNSDIINYHLGDTFVPEGKSSTMDANITVMLFDFGFLPKSYTYIYWGGFFQRSRYLTILKNSKIFMKVCNGLINKFVNDGRQILVVGERIKLLELLFKNSSCNSKGLFVGSSKLDKIDNQLTFTTPGKSRDGVDYVSKDCLILTSPISNIEQMTGRTLRIKEGKKQPIIIDLVDIGIKEIRETLYTRLEFYKSKNWKIRYIFVSSDGSKREIFPNDLKEILS